MIYRLFSATAYNQMWWDGGIYPVASGVGAYLLLMYIKPNWKAEYIFFQNNITSSKF